MLYPLPFSMSIESLEVCDSSSSPQYFAHWAGYVAALSLPTTELGWELLACPRTDKLCVLGFSSSLDLSILEVSVLPGWRIFC